MSYSINDSDVQTYLDYLNLQSITIDTQTDTGTQNLKKILTVIEDDLKELRFSERERLNLLTQRKLIVDKRLDSLDTNVYDNDDLETRYLEYKDEIRSLAKAEIKSTFMSVISQVIDTDLDSGMTQIQRYRRESIRLDFLITDLENQVAFLLDIHNQIQQLKSKIG